MGLSQAFSAGIFISIAVIHLLPEAAEGFEKYFNDNKSSDSIKKIPITYILVFCSFTLILFIEKIAFDSHSIIEHDHDDGDEMQDKKSQKSKKSNKKSESEKEKEDEDEDDIEEEVIKNLVSSTGRVGSFIMENNLSRGKKL